MSPLDTLLAIEEIKRLKARYFRSADSHDWAGYRACFADDAVFLPSTAPGADGMPAPVPGSRRIEGGDAIAAYAEAGLATATSVHTGGMPEIDILTPDTARGIWAMEDIVRWPGRVLHGRGYYHERYVRRDGRWLIASLQLARKSLRVEDLATTGAAIL